MSTKQTCDYTVSYTFFSMYTTIKRMTFRIVFTSRFKYVPDILLLLTKQYVILHIILLCYITIKKPLILEFLFIMSVSKSLHPKLTKCKLCKTFHHVAYVHPSYEKCLVIHCDHCYSQWFVCE